MILSLSLENREDKSFSTSVSLMNKKFNLIVVKQFLKSIHLIMTCGCELLAPLLTRPVYRGFIT